MDPLKFKFWTEEDDPILNGTLLQSMVQICLETRQEKS